MSLPHAKYTDLITISPKVFIIPASTQSPKSHHLNHREQIVAGNMNAKGASWEFSSGNEEHVICNWRKGDPCNEVGENLADCVLLDGR